MGSAMKENNVALQTRIIRRMCDVKVKDRVARGDEREREG